MSATRNPRQSRAALLAAAERLFAERGLAGARTEEIARAAGVNKALLHYYFGTKEKLYRVVLENLFQQLVAALELALAQPDSPRATLLRYIEHHFEFLRRHPHYPRLLQREVMRGRPFLRAIAQRYLQPLHGRLARLLRAGIRRGELRRLDVPNTIISLIGINVFYFAATPVVRHLLGEDPYHARCLAARKRAVIDFVQHGLLAKTSKET